MRGIRLSARRRAVKKLVVLSIAVLGFALSTGAQQTRGKMPTPPESMNGNDANAPQDSPNLQRRLDLAELQREADDLAKTAKTIPSDVASVRKGMMPKDVILKLKQIEKLSKQLRTKLNP
jgi:hypothetical protein